MVIPLGIVYFIVYYFLFHFLILKFDIKTPGREEEPAQEYEEEPEYEYREVFFRRIISKDRSGTWRTKRISVILTVVLQDFDVD